MSQYKLLAVGTDAECFLIDPKKGLPVPVIGLLGGTKHKPLPVLELGKGFCVQEDNVMAEFNVPPAKTAPEFSANIQKMLDHLHYFAGSKGLALDIVASHQFEKHQLEHRQACEAGCEPDFTVWTRGINEPIKNNPLFLGGLRTASAHVHVSFLVDGKKPANIYEREPVVKMLDLFLSLPSLFFDKDKKRKQLYGKAGAFRPTDYGIESRVMSNWWITKDVYRQWVFDGVSQGLYYLSAKGTKGIENHASLIQKAINESDKLQARTLLNHYNLWETRGTPSLRQKEAA